jgi:hypothetical protein
MDVVDVAVNRNITRDDWVFANTSHVKDARRLVLDRMPLDILAGARSVTMKVPSPRPHA